MDDVVAGVAPRAFGMSHGRDDAIFPREGVRRIRARARAAFPPGRFLSLELPGGHDFPAEARRRAYDFLRRQLGEGVAPTARYGETRSAIRAPSASKRSSSRWPSR